MISCQMDNRVENDTEPEENVTVDRKKGVRWDANEPKY